MNFFKKIGRAIGPTVSMGMWKPGQGGGGGGSMDSATPQKRTVEKTNQAGGGQIRFNTEETYFGSPEAKPQTSAPAAAAPQSTETDKPSRQQQIKNFYTDLKSRLDKYASQRGGASNEQGMRSEAAQRMLK